MKKLLFVSLISFTTLNDTDAQGTWIQKADFAGDGRFVAAAFSIGAKGYIGTGRGSLYGGFSKDFWEWDQASNVWTQKADFGGARKLAAAGFSVGTKGYIATGWDENLVFTQDLWEYDPAANTWTQKANLPGAGRYRATCFSIGTKGYLGTGYNGSIYFNDFWEWDQATNTWTQKADFPGAARLSAVSFSIGTKGYMGTGGDGNFVVNYNDFYEWDQATNTWTQIADFPGAARMGASAFSIDCKGYVGTGTSGTAYSDFWLYDPDTNTWTQKADYGGGAEAQAVGFSIGDYGYIGTGQTIGTGFWEFTPDVSCIVSAPGFSVSDTTLCEKFCTDYSDLSTNNPVSWQWIFEGGSPATSTDQNPAQICYNNSGTYDVTLITTDGGGNSDTLLLSNFITVFATPPFPIITQVAYTLTSSPANSYQWQLNAADIPGATNQSYTILQTGYYTVVVGDSNGCKNSATTYVLISGIDDLRGDANISVYPNPSSGNFMVEWLNGLMADEVSIDVVNTLGQNVFSARQKIPSPHWKKQIDLGVAAHGIYFIEIKTENEFVRKKILIAD
ncbi:MAG TPA: kelch repeat-containing protein [Chitinophagales bacterium]|nr:kelch repeat-containing protein [Chitinophagales bacterium]